jgi:hypothetical protein
MNAEQEIEERRKDREKDQTERDRDRNSARMLAVISGLIGIVGTLGTLTITTWDHSRQATPNKSKYIVQVVPTQITPDVGGAIIRTDPEDGKTWYAARTAAGEPLHWILIKEEPTSATQKLPGLGNSPTPTATASSPSVPR